MDIDAFVRASLESTKDAACVDMRKGILEDLDQFLRQAQRPDASRLNTDQVERFIQAQAKAGRSISDVLWTLCEYGHFIHHDPLVVTALEYLDGFEVMEAVRAGAEKALPPDACARVYDGLSMPQLHWPPQARSRFTHDLERRMRENGQTEAFEAVCEGVGHCWQPSWHEGRRDQFENAESLDAFLAGLNAEFIADLRDCMRDNRLFFTQPVTQAVVDHMLANPVYRREGGRIIATKIPYMADDYLAAPPGREKRFHACHCAWARHAILSDEAPVSRSFCACSLGYTKALFEVVFGRTLRGEVLETVLDPQGQCCRFAIEIPDDIATQAIHPPRDAV